MSTMTDTKGRRTRRSFTDDYKTGAVRLVLDEGKTVASAARDLGLTESSLRNWVEQARADRTKGKTGLTTAEREELVGFGSWGFKSPLPHQQLTDILAVRKLSCCQVCCQERASSLVPMGCGYLGEAPSGVLRCSVVRGRPGTDRPRSTRCGSGRHRPAVPRDTETCWPQVPSSASRCQAIVKRHRTRRHGRGTTRRVMAHENGHGIALRAHARPRPGGLGTDGADNEKRAVNLVAHRAARRRVQSRS